MITRLLGSLITALVVVLSGFELAAAQIQLKGVATSRPQVQFKLWEWLAEQVDKRTNGRVKIEMVSLPELGLTGFELVRVMRGGLVDVGDVLPTYVSGDVPLLEGVDLPGLFKDFATSERAHMAWHQVLKKHEDKLGGVFLGSYGWAYQVVYSRKPVRDIGDLKGLKVRVYGSALADFFRALGAEPVSLAVAEVYSAMERGAVDAGVTGTIAGFSLKWWEVSRQMVDVQLGPVMGTLVVSKRTWDRLPPDVRKLFEELGAEFTKRGWDLGRQSSKEGIDRNKEKGMEWVAPTPAMTAAIRDAVSKSVVPGWLKRAGPDGRAMFNQHIAPHAGVTIP